MSDRQQHPDPTELAEYREGLTGSLRGRQLAAHVASCPDCASVSEQLAAVSLALAAAPTPPMPDAVEHRITAALAAEAMPATEAQTANEAPPATPATPSFRAPGTGSPNGSRHDATGPGRGRRRSLRDSRRFRPAMVLSGAAAAALIAVGLAVGLSHQSGSPSHASAAGSSAAGSGARTQLASGKPAGPAQAPGIPGRASLNRSKPVFYIKESGTSYQPAKLATQVRNEMQSSTTAHEEPPSAKFAACVLHLTKVPPKLVDWATYAGKPAYVIAMPTRVWVVGTGCTASNPDLITSIAM